MPNLTISVDDELMRQIRSHAGINWSQAAREGIRRRLQEIHIWDELLKDSELTEDEVAAMADQVDEAMARRLQDLVE